MNDTILNFNYPSTLLRNYIYWVVLLRPNQITLGSLVLACKENSESLGGISLNAFEELSLITKEIEQTLSYTFDYDKINYLAYMMIDKQVHFHVIPRYSKKKKFNEIDFIDSDWPKPPNMSKNQKLSKTEFDKLKLFIKNQWQILKR